VSMLNCETPDSVELFISTVQEARAILDIDPVYRSAEQDARLAELLAELDMIGAGEFLQRSLRPDIRDRINHKLHVPRTVQRVTFDHGRSEQSSGRHVISQGTEWPEKEDVSRRRERERRIRGR
jgi:hypothetical protein